MPQGLQRFHHSGQSHFVTFSCYQRQPFFATSELFDRFLEALEDMRRRYQLCIYGYVVMPEHVHLLLSEPPHSSLADAMHYLKLSFAKRARGLRTQTGSFWQKRYYDRNVRNYREFMVKLRYLHRNPVKRGLVKEPEDWRWSSYRHYAFREMGAVEIESEWTANDRNGKPTGDPYGFSFAQVSAQKAGANLGHQAPGRSEPSRNTRFPNQLKLVHRNILSMRLVTGAGDHASQDFPRRIKNCELPRETSTWHHAEAAFLAIRLRLRPVLLCGNIREILRNWGLCLLLLCAR